MSQLWEQKYPLVSLNSLIRVGSDHNPLLLETDISEVNMPIFRFESMWLQQQGFRELVIKKIPDRGNQNIQNYRKQFKQAIRKTCKG